MSYIKKQISIAKNIQELNSRAETSTTITSAKIGIKSSDKIMKLADEAYLDGDEEKAYLYYMRWYNTIMLIKKTKDYQKDKKYYDVLLSNGFTKSVRRAEELSANLKIRYQELEAIEVSQKLESFTPQSTFELIEDMENNKLKNENIKNEITKETKSIDSFLNKGNLSAYDFFQFSNNYLQTNLLIDTRRVEDFEQCYLVLKNIMTINVPSTIIHPGCTAKNIGSKLQSIFQTTWNQRGIYDKLILCDYKSKSIETNSPFLHLKNAITKWSEDQKLKSEPMVLEGGFQEWCLLYPMFTSNIQFVNRFNQQSFEKDDFEDLPSIESICYDIDFETHKSSNHTVNNSLNSTDTSLQDDLDEKFPILQTSYSSDKTTEINNGYYINIGDNDINNKNISFNIPLIDRSTKPKLSIQKSDNELLNEPKSNLYDIENKISSYFTKLIIKPNVTLYNKTSSSESLSNISTSSLNINLKNLTSNINSNVIDLSNYTLDPNLAKMKADESRLVSNLLREKRKLESDIKKRKEEILELNTIYKIKRENGEKLQINESFLTDSNKANNDSVKSSMPSSIVENNKLEELTSQKLNLENDLDSIDKKLNNLQIKNENVNILKNTLQTDNIKNNNLIENFEKDRKINYHTNLHSIQNKSKNPLFKDFDENENFTEQSSINSVIHNQTSKNRYLTSLKDENSIKSSYTTSNLKRSHSYQNVAELDDNDQSEIKKLPSQKKPNNLSTLDYNNEKLNSLAVSNINTTQIDKRITIPEINRLVKPSSSKVLMFNPSSTILLSNQAISDARVRNLQPIWGNVKPGLTGLRNLGNTCYMNSIIQCLNNCYQLTFLFASDQYKLDINRTSKHRGEIAGEFAFLTRVLWMGKYKIISPYDFRQSVSRLDEMFSTRQQQDSQEMLGYLINGLNEDLNKVKEKKSYLSLETEKLEDEIAADICWERCRAIENSFVADLFRGQYKSVVICSKCEYKSTVFESFMTLTLNIPAKLKGDISDCLLQFSKEEKMTGDCKWFCSQCKCKRDATKRIVIWRLPQILIIHLKRFHYEGIWRDKISTLINFPIEKLDMARYLSGPTRNQSQFYELFAISNHYGTLDGGHYTAFCKNIQLKKWHKFDDSEVSEVNTTSIVSSAAYILFYSKI